jgi:hypothetical protein
MLVFASFFKVFLKFFSKKIQISCKTLISLDLNELAKFRVN